MNLPVLKYPMYVNELSEEFQPLFTQSRQIEQFKRLMSGFVIADRCTIANMNGLFIFHTNQSNLNRFVTHSKWSRMDMLGIEVNLINTIEKKGILVLDDYIVVKNGTEIYGVDWHWDHCKNESVFGHQIADCILTGRGIFPLLSTVYVKEKSRWCNNDFKTKIELQMEHITQLVNCGLDFSCVVMDTWYFCKELFHLIRKYKKDWIAQCKSNKKIYSGKNEISLLEFAMVKINQGGFKVVKIDEDTYLMKAFTVRMKGMGRVRVLISLNKHNNYNFYVTNRLDWKEVAIAKRYAKRWCIEVWHRDGKGNFGLEDCQLRSNDAISRYLMLSSLAANLLEIASMLSPVYATLKNQGCTPETKHRWVLIELVLQLLSTDSKLQEIDKNKVIDSILFPYLSTIKGQNVIYERA